MKIEYYKKTFDGFVNYYKVSPIQGKSRCVCVYNDGDIHIYKTVHEQDIKQAEIIDGYEYNEIRNLISNNL